MSEILQREETLDSCIIGGMRTFRNGCNFKAKINAKGDTYLAYGCYGVHINLAQGEERLLMNWLEKNKNEDGWALLNIEPETRRHIMKQIPCEVCGGLAVQARE